MKRTLAGIAILLLLLGVFRVVDRARTPSSPDIAAGASGVETAEDTPAVTDSVGAGVNQVAGNRVALTVEGEGLRFFDVETGSARPIAFGTAEELTRSALAGSQGGEIVEEGESFECGNRFARLANGLTVWYRNAEFVGWSLRDPPLTTAGGIGVGSTRADLESVYDAQIFDSSLGVEFTAGALAGLLATDSPDARILNLWAGETCIAR